MNVLYQCFNIINKNEGFFPFQTQNWMKSKNLIQLGFGGDGR